MHLAQGEPTVDQVAQPKPDRHRVDAPVRLGKLADVRQTELDVRFKPPCQLEHCR
jgi:hypothetical protein